MVKVNEWGWCGTRPNGLHSCRMSVSSGFEATKSRRVSEIGIDVALGTDDTLYVTEVYAHPM